MPTSHVRLLAAAAVASLALAACGSSSKSSSSSSTTLAPTTTVATPTTPAPNPNPTVSRLPNATIGKPILVDSSGMTLYVSTKDTTNTSECAKTAACIQAWPPVFVTGTPTYGTALDATSFSTFETANGSKWLTVNGKPLYTWVNDKKSGDATGQGINNFYVVNANDGQPIDNS